MTGTLKAKVNGVWVPIGGGSTPVQQWNSAWGRIAFASTNTQQSITTVVDLNGLSVTVTPPAGRMLLITLSLVMQCDTAGKRMDALITDAANVSFQLRSVTASTASGDETMIVQVYATTAGAAMTFKGRAQNGSGGGTMYLTAGRASFISVEDVGPAAGAISVENPAPRVGGKWRRSAAQSLPANTPTAIVWDTEEQDTHGFGAPGSGVITIPSGCGGIYGLTAAVYLGTGPTTGDAEISLPGATFTVPPSVRTGWSTISCTYALAAGNTIGVNGWVQAGFTGSVAQLQLYRVGA